MPSDLKHLNSARLPIYSRDMFCDDHDPAAYGDRDISAPKFFGTHYTRRHSMTHTNQIVTIPVVVVAVVPVVV